MATKELYVLKLKTENGQRIAGNVRESEYGPFVVLRATEDLRKKIQDTDIGGTIILNMYEPYVTKTEDAPTEVTK